MFLGSWMHRHAILLNCVSLDIETSSQPMRIEKPQFIINKVSSRDVHVSGSSGYSGSVFYTQSHEPLVNVEHNLHTHFGILGTRHK